MESKYEPSVTPVDSPNDLIELVGTQVIGFTFERDNQMGLIMGGAGIVVRSPETYDQIKDLLENSEQNPINVRRDITNKKVVYLQSESEFPQALKRLGFSRNAIERYSSMRETHEKEARERIDANFKRWVKSGAPVGPVFR